MYADIAEMQNDSDLRRRLVACAAQEDAPKPYEGWVDRHIWDIVGSPGWDAAWAAARAASTARPGWDGAVITDAMILAAVQPRIPVLSPVITEEAVTE